MSLIEWSEEFFTGNVKVDEEHKELFRLVNALHEAMMQGRGKDVIGGTLEALSSYTQRHFRDEETLMRTHNYPDYSQHKRVHDELSAQVRRFVTEMRGGKTVLTIEVLHFISGWLQHHIHGSDKKMIDYVRTAASAAAVA